MARLISIIDDNTSILSSLSLQFKSHGYTTRCFSSSIEALEHHTKHPADFYIIDIKMFGLDGIEFYETLCQKLDVIQLPAVFLSAGDGFEAQCLRKTTIADFIKKPFSFDGLRARIERIMGILNHAKNDSNYTIGNLVLYEDRITCSWFGKEIELTRKEFDLIKRLVRRPRAVFSREQLLELCYKDNYDITDRVIDSHFKRIRKKFQKVHPEKKFNRIKTFYASGYAWVPQGVEHRNHI